MKLLRIDSSARKNSVSRQLTADFVKSWRKQHPDGEVIERNLATTHLPHITDEWVQAVSKIHERNSQASVNAVQ